MWAVGALGVPLNLNAFGIQPRFYVFKTAQEKKKGDIHLFKNKHAAWLQVHW